MSEDAWILFNAHPARDRRQLNALLKAFGSPEKILGLSVSKLKSVPGVSTEFARTLLRQPQTFNLAAEKDLITQRGVHLLPISHPDYPANLKTIAEPPPLLYVTGNVIPEDRFAVAVVGSRKNTSYGRKVCFEIAGNLAKNGITVVSGLAYGIDSLAHQAALSADGRTIAVLGNGLALCYPPENEFIMREVARHGAVLSEYPMETPPLGKNFPERNGLIAGLAVGVLVVEASKRSGSLITARAALEENRSVYAVPGNIFKYAYQGTNALIRQGAQPVRSAEDILEDLSLVLRGMMK